MEKKPFNSIVDHVWRCGCGAMNSPYRETCGGCGIINTIKETTDE